MVQYLTSAVRNKNVVVANGLDMYFTIAINFGRRKYLHKFKISRDAVVEF